MRSFCFVYPEVAAGIQTVLQSPADRDGIYVTMDVGAGTVDLNAFIRYADRNNDVPLSYLSCEVIPLGVQRVEGYGSRSPYEGLNMADMDTRHPLDLLSESQVREKLSISIQSLIARAKVLQHNHGSAPGQRTWDRPCIYIWGGGSEIPLYREALESTLCSDVKIVGVESLALPVPPSLSMDDEIDFGRVTVAYGLSYHRANLEEILLPHEQKPMERPPEKPHITERRPGEPGYSSTMDLCD